VAACFELDCRGVNFFFIDIIFERLKWLFLGNNVIENSNGFLEFQ
jgi:hypothetical protein